MSEDGEHNLLGFPEPSQQELLKQMADQNSRLLSLLERLSLPQQAVQAVPNQRSSDQIVESLSSTIREFHYDPAGGLTFDRWFSKYEDLFREDGRALDNAAKIRLLLRSLSVEVHERFLNYLLPRHPREFTFDQVVEKLNAIFRQPKSLFSQRYECLQAQKNEADDYITYAGTINRHCENFDLARLIVDQFKALIFVKGLQSPKDSEIRARLLSKLESEGAAAINLNMLVEECQRIANLKHDTALVEAHHNEPSTVQAVQRFKPKVHQSDTTETPLPRSPCWQCGAMHYVKDCTYTTHVCKQCNQQGHKDGYCNCVRGATKPDNKQPYQGTKKKKPAQANHIHSINQIQHLRKYVATTINDQVLKLQLDCGSDITIISKESWEKCGRPVLNSSLHKANTASGEPLPIIGEFFCTLRIKKDSRQGICYVTSVKGLNLLGLDFIDAFNLWDQPLASVCNQVNRSNSIPISLNRYINRFPEVFREGLGLCRKTKVQLFLKPNAQPVFRQKRPVPFHAVEKVEAELQRLQQLGIISPVDYSDWAAPIVSVSKPGGKIRVCADYSTGLNAVLEPHQYPLPTPDDIFSKLAGSKVFSIIDLSDAYLQVEVEDESKKLLTINTHRGLFRFNRLSPGVKSAPGAFQQLIANMISNLEGVDNFLDDFIVYSKTHTEHVQKLDTLFTRIQDYGFRIRPEKCSIGNAEIKYLGFIVNAEGIKPDPEKVAAIANMPKPSDISSLRSFLGVVTLFK
ncbi:uncharacterized protein K02A2.6-like [Uranotaenia lowii]|uniref:uncharacterized protein K02A2.6-like n=1 Tax=Uranotaenia lowii TaxID=190385 RepID=UPI00247927A5|nr:uncharacterized protein K02A2.6-like [Uranotaenia lowii]